MFTVAESPLPLQICDHGPSDDSEIWFKTTVEDRDLGKRVTFGSFRCSAHLGFSGNFRIEEKI